MSKYRLVFTVWMFYPVLCAYGNSINTADEIIRQMNTKYLTCKCKKCKKTNDGQCSQKECNGLRITFSLAIRDQWANKNDKSAYKTKKNKIKGVLTIEKENPDNLIRYKLNIFGLYDICRDGYHKYISYKDKNYKNENDDDDSDEVNAGDGDTEDEETRIILKLKDIIINTTEILHVVYYTQENNGKKGKNEIYLDCIELEPNKEHKKYNKSEEEQENPEDNIERVFLYIEPKTKDLIKLEIIMESRILYVIEINKIALCIDTSHPSFFKFNSAKVHDNNN